MKKKITWGAVGGLLLFTGAANAAFTDLQIDPTTWSFTTGADGSANIFGTDLVQFSTGGAPSAVNNELFIGTGIVDNAVNPLTPLSTVDQVSLFGNNSGTLLTSNIETSPGSGVFVEYTHTDFLMTNNTGNDFTVSFAWELVTDIDFQGGLFSFLTNPFGSTTGAPLDALSTQLNTVGVNSGVVTSIDILNGTSFGFSLLTDTAFTDAFNNTVASIYDFTIDDLRPVVNVPEPGSLLLLAVGLVGLGVSRRRQKTC